MQSESSGSEKETPCLLWGLDPVFLAFAKLYIRDILGMKESGQVPGMWLISLKDALWFLSTPSSLSPELQKTGLPPPE
jgi:hypothetical protein